MTPIDQSTRAARPTRRAVLQAALAVAVAAGVPLGVSGASPAVAADGFTLRVGFIGTQPEWGSVEGYAFDDGLLLEHLAAAGVTDIESFQFGNGPDLNQALAGGSLDLGIYGDTPAINGRAAGLPTRVINQGRINLSATLYTPVDGATSLAELEGSTIGVPQGSYMHRFVLGLLETEGLTDSIEVVNLLIPDAAGALEGGDIGAFAAPWSAVPILDGRGFPQLLSTFPDYPELAGSSVTVVTESLLEDHPGVAEAWNEARTAAITAIVADIEPYYDAQQPILNVDRAVVPDLEEGLANFPTEPFTAEGVALLTGTKQFLVDIDAAQSDFELTDWVYPDGALDAVGPSAASAADTTADTTGDN